MNSRTTAMLPTLLAVILVSSGCSTVDPADRWLRSEIYFGLSRPDGKVTGSEWDSFVQEEVARRFPEGFTIVEGHGHWLGEQGPIQEESRIVLILHDPQGRAHQKIEELCRIYCCRFDQEAVLHVEHQVTARFLPRAQQ